MSQTRDGDPASSCFFDFSGNDQNGGSLEMLDIYREAWHVYGIDPDYDVQRFILMTRSGDAGHGLKNMEWV